MNMRVLRDFDNDHRAFYAYLYVELVHGCANAYGGISPKRRGMARSGIQSQGTPETSVFASESVIAGYFEILRSRIDEGRLVGSGGVERGSCDGTRSDEQCSSVGVGDGRWSVEDRTAVDDTGDDSDASTSGSTVMRVDGTGRLDGVSGRLGRVERGVASQNSVSVASDSGCVACVRGPNYERNKQARAKAKRRAVSSERVVDVRLQESWDERRIAENKVAVAQAKKKLEALDTDDTVEIKKVKSLITKAKAELELKVIEQSDPALLVEAERLKKQTQVCRAKEKLDATPEGEVTALREQLLALEMEGAEQRATIMELEKKAADSKQVAFLKQDLERARYKLDGETHRHTMAKTRIMFLEDSLKSRNDMISKLQEEVASLEASGNHVEKGV